MTVWVVVIDTSTEWNGPNYAFVHTDRKRARNRLSAVAGEMGWEVAATHDTGQEYAHDPESGSGMTAWVEETELDGYEFPGEKMVVYELRERLEGVAGVIRSRTEKNDERLADTRGHGQVDAAEMLGCVFEGKRLAGELMGTLRASDALEDLMRLNVAEGKDSGFFR